MVNRKWVERCVVEMADIVFFPGLMLLILVTTCCFIPLLSLIKSAVIQHVQVLVNPRTTWIPQYADVEIEWTV